jgi:hypothetical protein
MQGKKIDLLQIDTEGVDGYILSRFPLSHLQQAITHWEVKHLSTPLREECLARLANFGYRFALSVDEDTLPVVDVEVGTTELH